MKRIFVALMIAACSLVSQAATPSQQSVELLLNLIQAERMIDSLQPQIQGLMKSSMEQALAGKKPTTEEQKILDRYVYRSSLIMGETLTPELIKSVSLPLYSQYFTQEEVDAMIAFYQTPVGQSMITKMPQVMQGVMAAMPTLMRPMMEKMRVSNEQLVNELRAVKERQGKAGN
ncbi:Domain of unknown function DUF2059 [Comamonadaceae bacterium]